MYTKNGGKNTLLDGSRAHHSPFRTKYDEQAILTDLFRLLCFDFLVRKGTLSSEEICIISNVVQEPVRCIRFRYIPKKS